MSKNENRKFRRKQAQVNPNGRIEQGKPFNQNEQRILGDVKMVHGISKTNQSSINAINTQLNELGVAVQTFSSQMDTYDKKVVSPAIEKMTYQIGALTELFLNIAEQNDFVISDQIMKDLDLEVAEEPVPEKAKKSKAKAKGKDKK